MNLIELQQKRARQKKEVSFHKAQLRLAQDRLEEAEWALWAIEEKIRQTERADTGEDLAGQIWDMANDMNKALYGGKNE